MYRMTVYRKISGNWEKECVYEDKTHVLDMLVSNMKYKYLYKANGYKISRKNNCDGTETITVFYTDSSSEPTLHYKTEFIIPR